MDTQKTRTSEQVAIEDSPFSESAASARFYPGGRRREVLDGMVNDLTGGIPIVTLTGDEGSGKTVLCRMLVERLRPDHATIYFPQTADSFEDVLKAIVQGLGLVLDPAPKDRAGLLQGIVAHLHSHHRRVVLVFDEAERIYLATLERVRKMLDQANDEAVFIQMVMSGRSGLHHNFRNLALVNFQPAEERHFTLEPLSEEQTYEYLLFTTGNEAPEKRSLFSREAAAAIFASSRGNLRTIARLADGLWRADEARAQVAPVEVAGQARKVQRDKGRRRLQRPTVTLPKFTFNRRYLVWGGGAACLLAVALLLLRPTEEPVQPRDAAVQEHETSIAISQPKEMTEGETDTEAAQPGNVEGQEQKEPVAVAGNKEKEPPPQPASTPAAAKPVVVSMPKPPQSVAGGVGPEVEEKPRPVDQPAAPPPATVETEKSAASAPVEPVVVSMPQQAPPPAADSGSATAEKQPPTAPIAAVAERQMEKEQEPPPPPPATEIRPAERTGEPVVAEPAPVAPASPGQPQPEVVEVAEPKRPVAATEETPIVPQSITARTVVKHREQLVPAVHETIASQRLKILKQEEPDALEEPATPVTIRAVEQKKAPELETQSADSAKAAAPASTRPKKITSPDGIYASRVAAGATWFSGIKDDRYTVRLMVVTSGDAEKKLKSMLGEKKYREQADKFYILRRESNPGVQYVYYGEYPTMTAARNARNTIPEFLRGYRPYAMSVKGAVERAQQEE